MDIKNKVLEIRHSRNKKEFVNDFIADKSKTKDLIRLVVDQEPYPYQEYASWIVLHLCKEDPKFMQPYYKLLVDSLLQSSNQSVLRNITCGLLSLQLKTYREGELLSKLFDFLKNPNNKVALHVYSIYLLMHFIDKYPELKNETDVILKHFSGEKSMAFQVAIKKYQKI